MSMIKPIEQLLHPYMGHVIVEMQIMVNDGMICMIELE